MLPHRNPKTERKTMSDAIGTKTITIYGEPVTIKKLPIRKVVGLFDFLKKLPAELKSQLQNFNVDKSDIDFMLEEIPSFLTGSLDQFAGLIAFAANSEQVTEEKIKDLYGLDDGVALIEAIIEVNNAKFIMERIKKAVALYRDNPELQIKGINPMLRKKTESAGPVIG